MPQQHRFLGLELLRFLLAATVAAFHYFYYGPLSEQIPKQLFLSEKLAYGSLAVPLFFIISGFVINKSVEGKSWSDFFIARFSRLYPSLLLCASITAFPYFLAGSENSTIVFFAWTKAALFFPVAQGGVNIDPSYWSLAFEWRFYGLVVLLILLARARNTDIILTVISLFGLVGNLLGFSEWLAWLIFPYASFFAIGVILKNIQSNRTHPIFYALLVINIAVAAHGNLTDILPFKGLHSENMRIFLSMLTSILSVAIFLVFLYLPIPAAFSPLVRMFGAMSYPFYLVHQVIGYIIIVRLTSLGMSPWNAVLFSAVFALSISFVAAKYIEPRYCPSIKRYMTRQKSRFTAFHRA